MQQLSTVVSLQKGNKDAQRPLVLVIDGAPVILDILSSALQLQGYQPKCFLNAQEALKWIENALGNGQYPRAILLDVLMPTMNGGIFLTNLSTIWKAALAPPLIFLLTIQVGDQEPLACQDVLQNERLTKSFHVDVLTKPFHLRQFGERLRSLIDYPPASGN